ncbi:MAG TPA: pyridoxamine 5'-phosphate oxidase [Leucothrix mucor]|nr:pyridoxamine 5'-phosphate oxidase [Leucothrix mucor]
MDLGDYRREYTKDGLRREDLSDSPFEQFEKWFMQADEATVIDASAMSLATVSAEGKPSLRTVLLKTFDESGFVFYTNYSSQKSQQIEQNANVALLFPWTGLERQIEITGRAEKVSTAESLKYFLSRPKGSQLGAWASNQSSPITSRSLLEIQLNKMKQKFQAGEIPLPDFWGGYRVIPEKIEFWQGGTGRIHDRFEYQREGASWLIVRLQP